MATYRFSRCPHCNYFLEWRARYSYLSYYNFIGNKYERCPNCKKIYATNLKYYNEMNIKEKNNIKNLYYKNIISSILSICFIIFIILLCIFKELSNIKFIILTIILSISSSFICYKNSIKEFEKIKKLEFDKLSCDDLELRFLNDYKKAEDIKTNKIIKKYNQPNNKNEKKIKMSNECKICGRTIIEFKNNLCEECNTMLQEIRKEKASKKFCTNCGNSIKNNWNYCYHCGNKLTQEE